MRGTLPAFVHPGGMCRLAELTVWEETGDQAVPFSNTARIQLYPAMSHILFGCVVIQEVCVAIRLRVSADLESLLIHATSAVGNSVEAKALERANLVGIYGSILCVAHIGLWYV